jgi:hypothetical protein
MSSKNLMFSAIDEKNNPEMTFGYSVQDIERLMRFYREAKAVQRSLNGAAFKQIPGGVQFPFKDDIFAYEEEHIGSLTGKGHQLITLNELPVWSMNYWGGVLPKYFSQKYAALVNQAVAFNNDNLRTSDLFSYRTDLKVKEEHQKGELKLITELKGNIASFNGTRTVYDTYFDDAGSPILKQQISGGLFVYR